MIDENRPLGNSSLCKKYKFPRILSLFAAIVIIAISLSTVALAVWDGSGSTPGNTNTSEVIGDFSLDSSGTAAIIGYRFSVYDGDGTKLG